MSIGEVVTCAHCKGSGTCSCIGCNPAQNHIWIEGDDGLRTPVTDVCCTSCGGAGKVWVGPNIVQLPPT